MAYEIKNPRRVRANMIDVEWQHPDFGLIPYTCVNNSGETEMQEIWDGITRGDYGPIKEAT